ncbi:MAG: HEAT repeat domain-containing protein [Planctomycetota bacterium]|nr:HEAT repeat domain-containing protein [Planctomycetota bacterium]
MFDGSRLTAFSRIFLLFVLMLYSSSTDVEAQGLDHWKEQFRQQKNLEVLERIDAIQKIGEMDTLEASEFLAKIIEDRAEKTSIIESAIRLVALHRHAVGLKAVVESGFTILPTRSYWVIRDCWDRDLSQEEADYLAETGILRVPALDIESQNILLSMALRADNSVAGESAAKILGNRKIAPHNQALIVDLIRLHRVDSVNKKLGKLFRVNDAKLQVAVLQALQQLEADDQSRTFHKALKSTHWTVRACAVDIFGDTHDPDVVKVLLPMLKDPFVEVQVSTVMALRKIGGKEVAKALVKQVGQQKGRVLDDICDALVWLTGQDYGPSEVSWTSWWDREGADAKIEGISREEYERIRAEASESSTGTYYGLRVISRFVTFIVDISGSMEEPYEVDSIKLPGGRIQRGGTGVAPGDSGKTRKREKLAKIEVARRELVRVLDGIPNGTQFNIIAFESTFTPWRPALVEMEEGIRSDAMDYVRSLGPRGMTNVYDTLVSAFDDPDVNTIYFLSDGSPTMGKIVEPGGILAAIRSLNQQRKVKIHTIGFHLDPAASQLMRLLAEENHGTFVER